MSVIETPPKDRLSIHTVVAPFQPELIRSAIELELGRGGQIYFVHNTIETIEKTPVDTGVLDISFYRDDLSTAGPRPVVEKGDIGFDVNGRDIILMDDVLYTGRTIRAALDALFDQGRPKSVQLLVLIDRGHRELPIEARFIGRTVPTSRREIIEVKLREVDNDEQVLLVELAD